MNKLQKILIFALIGFAIGTAISVWKPWHRQPTVFYDPIFLPMEVIKGDIIMFSNGVRVDVDHDKRITSYSSTDNSVTINSTVHLNLWEILTK